MTIIAAETNFAFENWTQLGIVGIVCAVLIYMMRFMVTIYREQRQQDREERTAFMAQNLEQTKAIATVQAATNVTLEKISEMNGRARDLLQEIDGMRTLETSSRGSK